MTNIAHGVALPLNSINNIRTYWTYTEHAVRWHVVFQKVSEKGVVYIQIRAKVTVTPVRKQEADEALF